MSSEVFETGAQRGSQVDKGRPDLISPFATRSLARILEAGARKYGDRNWEKGIPIMRHLASAKRHIDQFIMRETHEVEDGKTVPVNHLGNAYANLMMALHTLEMVECGVLSGDLDDRPVYQPISAPKETTQVLTNRYRQYTDGYLYFVITDCPKSKPYDLRRVRHSPHSIQYWWPLSEAWLDNDDLTNEHGVCYSEDELDDTTPYKAVKAYINYVTFEEWQQYVLPV